MKVFTCGKKKPFKHSQFEELKLKSDKELMVKSITCGYNHILLLTEDNKLFGAGCNEHGELSLGHVEHQSEFKQIDSSIFGNQRIRQIVCGHHSSGIITENGELWLCGRNTCGMLGLGEAKLGDVVNKFCKVNIKGSVTNVALGSDHSLIVTDGKHLWSSGSNAFGELGSSAAFAQYEFERVDDLSGKTVKQISCGMRHSVVLTEDSQLYVTGNGLCGQLGLKDNDNRNRFTHCLFIHNIKQIACGWFHTAILTPRNELFVTGNATNGELATGIQKNINVFKHVVTNFKLDRLCMTSATGSTMLLTESNEIVGCGYNMYGALCLHKATKQLEKIPFKSDDNIAHVAHGSDITAIVTSPIQISRA